MDIFSEGARHAANRPVPFHTPENSPNFAMARRQIGRINAQIPDLSLALNFHYQQYLKQSEDDRKRHFPNFVEPTTISSPQKKTGHHLVRKDGFRTRRYILDHQKQVGSTEIEKGWTIFDTKHLGGNALKLMLGLSGMVYETDAHGVNFAKYDIRQDLPPSFLFFKPAPTDEVPDPPAVINQLAQEAFILKNHPQNRQLAQDVGTYALAFADIYQQQVVELVANNLN